MSILSTTEELPVTSFCGEILPSFFPCMAGRVLVLSSAFKAYLARHRNRIAHEKYCCKLYIFIANVSHYFYSHLTWSEWRVMLSVMSVHLFTGSGGHIPRRTGTENSLAPPGPLYQPLPPPGQEGGPTMPPCPTNKARPRNSPSPYWKTVQYLMKLNVLFNEFRSSGNIFRSIMIYWKSNELNYPMQCNGLPRTFQVDCYPPWLKRIIFTS